MGKENEFSTELKRRVREEQAYQCAFCGASCRGHAFGEPILPVHHIIPRSKNGSNTRENAVGLCGPDCNNCHHYFDEAVFKENKTYWDVLMETGKWYQLAEHPGNPYHLAQAGD